MDKFMMFGEYLKKECSKLFLFEMVDEIMDLDGI